MPDGPLKSAVASAQLAYLQVQHRLQISDGRVTIPRQVNGSYREVDPQAAELEAKIISSLDRGGVSPRLPELLTSIGPMVYGEIAAALVRDGTVQRPRRRSGARMGGAWPPADALAATLPAQRLNQVIRDPRAATLADAFKIALLLAVEVPDLLDEPSEEFRRQLHVKLPPQFRLLLAEVARAP